MYSVIAGAINHPDPLNPYTGIFNRRILESLSERTTDLGAVAPRPFAPPVGPYSSFSSIPETEQWGSYTIHYPRFWYLLPKRLFYSLSGRSYARRIPAYLETHFERPDVVQACHIYPDGYGMLPYVQKHNLPLFVISHGTLLNTLADQPPGVRNQVRKTLDEATGVLCVSDALAERASRLTDPDKVATVPIGADPEKYPVGNRRRLRQEFDIPQDATVVLFVGRFTKEKGIEEIIESLSNLDCENTVFVFIGSSGSLEGALRRAVGNSPFSSRYIYSGLPPIAVRRWYAVADLLLLPSHSEGRPTVIYEAMASETAVLASAVGGVPEQVVDGETGRLLPPGGVEALKESLLELCADRDQLERMGKAGKSRLLEQGWTWSDYGARIRDIHLDAIGRK